MGNGQNTMQGGTGFCGWSIMKIMHLWIFQGLTINVIDTLPSLVFKYYYRHVLALSPLSL